MTTEHAHTHGSAAGAARGGSKYRRRLLWAFAVIGVYFAVELVGGLLTNSLALLSDAGHMFTDVLGLGMALAAIHAAGRARDPQKTFGLYRLEILAALGNAVLLFGVAGYVVYEAVQRFRDPPPVLGGPMLLVAGAGLAVNLFVFFLLRKSADESINVEGAYLEVLADLFGSVGAVTAAVVIQTTGFRLIDPLFGVAIGLFVFPRTWQLGKKALRILIQAAPPTLSINAARNALLDLEGVANVHDLHVWTLTSGMEVCSVHVSLEPEADGGTVLNEAYELLSRGFGVDHPTIQIEPGTFVRCDQGVGGARRW